MHLKNPLWNKKLERDGYLLVDLIEPSKLDDLKSAYLEIHKEDFGSHLYFSNQQGREEYRLKVRDLLRDFFQPLIDRFFVEVEGLEGIFIVKPPGGDTFADHQDWSLVDEKKYRSFGLWIPLQDVNETNGTFQVLPGSHKFFQLFRSPTIPNSYFPHERLIAPYKKLVPMKKGQGLIFDHALVHSTLPNQSKADRFATFIGVRPKEAKWLHFYHELNSAEIQKFHINSRFFYNYDMRSRPDASIGEFSEAIALPDQELSPTELKEKIVRACRWQSVDPANLSYAKAGIRA